MVMISPCAGCDAPALAHFLSIFEVISGFVTIIKSAWWHREFRIPLSTLDEVAGVNPSRNSDIGVDTDSTSADSIITDANANNMLWTITGMTMGTLNIVLAIFFLVGLINVNYTLVALWCAIFPMFYIIDCILLTFLLKHSTSKERFERCRLHYISCTILTFIFHSYVLWVGISVIHWCRCRRDPYKCSFSRDYCHSLHLNFSSGSTTVFSQQSMYTTPDNDNDLYRPMVMSMTQIF